MIPHSDLIHGLCQVAAKYCKTLIAITFLRFYTNQTTAQDVLVRKDCVVLMTNFVTCDVTCHDAARQACDCSRRALRATLTMRCSATRCCLPVAS